MQFLELPVNANIVIGQVISQLLKPPVRGEVLWSSQWFFPGENTGGWWRHDLFLFISSIPNHWIKIFGFFQGNNREKKDLQLVKKLSVKVLILHVCKLNSKNKPKTRKYFSLKSMALLFLLLFSTSDCHCVGWCLFGGVNLYIMKFQRAHVLYLQCSNCSLRSLWMYLT